MTKFSCLFIITILLFRCSESIIDSKSNSQYRILFTNARGTENIFSINEDGTNIIQHTFFDNYDSWWPVWVSDGSRIIFYQDSDIYSISFNGNTLKNLTTLFERDYNMRPDVSPNGNSIAYQSELNNVWNICVIDTTSNNFSNITNDNINSVGPVWSPDGSSILFYNSTDKKLEMINSNGTDRKQIITNDEIFLFSYNWLNNSEIFYSSLGKVYRIDIDGNNKKLLTDSTKVASFPSYCDQISKFTFIYSYDSKYEIWRMNKNGSNEQKVIEVTADHTEPKYSPDGTKILYFENWHLYIVNSNGSNKKKLTADENAYERYYSWSPVKF